jgi:hypothetical protein
MEQFNPPRKMRIALLGIPKAPKLYTALQLAYGLCGDWNKIIVLGSSPKQECFHQLGEYNTLNIPDDAMPQRYMEALNLVGCSGKQVVIFSSFSNEWKEGVSKHLHASYYEEVLRSHSSLMRVLRYSPMHVICCVDTQRKFSYTDHEGRPVFKFVQEAIQQCGFERNFTSVAQIGHKGNATSLRDATGHLPKGEKMMLSSLTGAYLHEWCIKTKNRVPESLQQRIDSCNTMEQLNELMWEEEPEETVLLEAFTKRMLELEAQSNNSSSGTSQHDRQLHIVQ